MFPFYSVVHNLLLLLFILMVRLSQVCPTAALQADSCVFLTRPHHSVSTSLLSDTNYIPDISCVIQAQP